MTIKDSLALAYRTIKSNKVRTNITVIIIALGIAALIFIITVIESMNSSLRENFMFMGANSFNIRFKERRAFFGSNEERVTKGKRPTKSSFDKPITLQDAELFKEKYSFPALTSVYLRGPNAQIAYFESKKTNPEVNINGSDENFLTVFGYNIDYGRNFSLSEVKSGINVCMIGSTIAQKLFDGSSEKIVDKIIRVGNTPYRIIAVLKSKGASSFLRQDNVVVTPYNSLRKIPNVSNTYTIGVSVDDLTKMEPAIGEATSAFRAVRKLEPLDADNFAIEKSDKLAETLIGMLGAIQGSAGAIGLVTLFGAAIGLMNIMLVAVNERTREIGLVKAIGGKKSNIRQQFLFESMIISIYGAVWGIISGVLLGNIVGIFLKTGFVMPWDWVIAGVIICAVVGLLAGVYPAYKASKLNPINALRYE